MGEDKASCMTRMSLADLVAARENVLSQYFQTFLEYTQGLPALVKTTAGSSGIRTPRLHRGLEPKSSALDHSATLPMWAALYGPNSTLPPSRNKGKANHGASSRNPSNATEESSLLYHGSHKSLRK